MCSSTESTNKSRFHIELLADKSLVLVNARGYESEIFLPELQKGRVCLRNVIFSRQPRSPPDEINSCSSSSNHQCKRMGSVKLTTATAGLAPNPGRIDNIGELRFELKLISNGNVVLVECKGYESEIFLPHIFSHCVAMKRISAYELAQCSSLKSSTTKPSNESPASIAASLGTQTAGLPNCLITPIKAGNVLNKEKRGQRLHKSQQVTKTKKKTQKEKSSPRQKKKRCKQYVKEPRDVSN